MYQGLEKPKFLLSENDVKKIHNMQGSVSCKLQNMQSFDKIPNENLHKR